jgi:hypothetical protein
MALKNGPGLVPSFFPVVVKGKRTLLGTITTAGDQLQFSLAPDSYAHSGSVIFQIIPVAPAGTITTLTCDVQISLDGGVTFNAQVAAGAATVASNTAGINFQTGHLQSVALPGVGAEAALQFVAATLVFGTATAITVWALMA